MNFSYLNEHTRDTFDIIKLSNNLFNFIFNHTKLSDSYI